MAENISHSQDRQNDPASSPEHAVYTPTVEESAIYFQAALRRAIQKARRGDPWEFIALQWPGLELGEREIAGGYFQTMLRLDDSQVDIVRHVFAPDHTELFVKGCTKYGKGYSAALVVNVWFDVFPESKIILTGPDYNHVRNNLFAEVVSLRKQMVAPGGKRVELVGLSEDEALEALGIRGAGGDGSGGGGFGSGAMIGSPQQSKDIQSDRIVDKENTKHYIVIANPKTGEGFSGQHSSHTMFVFDESSVVDRVFYENAKKQARFILALSNPRVLSGWFYEGFGKFDPDVTKSVQTTFGRRRLVTADGGATVNVRFKRIEKPFAPPDGITVRGVEYQAGEPIPLDVYEDVAPLIPAQIDYARYFDIMSDPDENNRNVYGRGRFPREDAELQVVLASWVDRAQKAWDGESIEVDSFGFDVATSDHGDTSSLAAGSGAGCREIHVRQGAEATVTAGWLVSKIRESYGIDLKLGRHPVAIDYGGGYGSGVGSLLREMGVWVIPVVPNERSNDPKKYVNKRAEMWGRLGNRLDPKREWGESPPWALPCDPLMAEDMLAQEKIIKSDGISFQLIPKSKTNASYNGKVVKDKLGGRSPDRGDAVALLWWAVSSNLTVDDYAGRSLVLGVAGDDGLVLEAERRREVVSRLGKAAAADAEPGKPAAGTTAVLVELSPEERMAVEWDRELSRVCGLMDSQYDEEGRAGF